MKITISVNLQLSHLKKSGEKLSTIFKREEAILYTEEATLSQEIFELKNALKKLKEVSK